MSKRLKWLILLCGGLGVFAFLGGNSVSRNLTFNLLLWQPAPSELAIFETVSLTKKPQHLLQALWDSGKIPHRHLAIKYIHQHLAGGSDEYSKYAKRIDEAVSDADFANRELAMGVLDSNDREKLNKVLARSLRDSDQGTRLRALQFIKSSDEQKWMPELIRLLDDPDPMIVAHAASKLRQWTGKDFGIRMIHAIARSSQHNQPAQLDAEQSEALLKGTDGWKRWWRSDQSAHAQPEVRLEGMEPFVTPALEVEDFEITLLDGSTKRLSDFRGKAVILNFWTTWCSTCMTEMPDFNLLHDQYSDTLQIIGISLDGSDGHGHEHASIVDMEEARKVGLEAVQSEYGLGEDDHQHSDSTDHTHHEHAHDKDQIAKIVKKITRVVRKKELKYLVGMDPNFEIGNRFNGQELPTNVLIDPDGNLRRRFVGARPIHSWKAMLKDVGVSDPSSSQ